MAYVPSRAKLIDNPVSIAPGFYIENVFVFPGVPKILEVMLKDVLKRFKKNQKKFIKKNNYNHFIRGNNWRISCRCTKKNIMTLKLEVTLTLRKIHLESHW